MEPQRKPMTLELMISSLTGNEALSSLHMAATAVAISTPLTHYSDDVIEAMKSVLARHCCSSRESRR